MGYAPKATQKEVMCGWFLRAVAAGPHSHIPPTRPTPVWIVGWLGLGLVLLSCGSSSEANDASGERVADAAMDLRPGSDRTVWDGGPPLWVPPPGTTWQWQLEGEIDLSVEAQVFDIDLFEVSTSVVTTLHTRGSKVFCYMSAGSWEDWRPDKDQFPSIVLGKNYEGWPGERWLDIRRIDILGPIMQSRLDLCREKGFDGVEPDNIDGYKNDTGFPLTYEDQLAYNTWLAEEAHIRGLSIGLKNDSEQVQDLVDHFDWALTEDCFAQKWCPLLSPFVVQGKAVFMAEYTDTGVDLNAMCSHAGLLKFSAILKHRELDAWLETCP